MEGAKLYLEIKKLVMGTFDLGQQATTLNPLAMHGQAPSIIF